MSDALVELVAAQARGPFATLAPATLTLGAGAHAFVGAREDGVDLVLDVLAGNARVRGGRARVLGGDPRRGNSAVAHVGRDAALPEVLRVGEWLAMAAEVRGAAAGEAGARLAALGLGPLAQRLIGSLAPEEARGVALAEALTSRSRVILLDEPFVGTDPRAASVLAAAVAARAAEGACVIVGTASPREAVELADDHHVLTRGAFVRRTTGLGELLACGSGPARLRVVLREPRALVAALAGEPAVRATEADAGSVTVLGDELGALAEAVARGVVSAGLDVESIRSEALPLAELRASIAGDAAGAYHAARSHAQAPVPPPPRAPSVDPPPDPGGAP